MISLLLALLAQTAPAPVQTPPAGKAAPISPEWAYKETTSADGTVRSAVATVRDPGNGFRLIMRCDVAKESIISVQFIPKPPLAAGDSRQMTLTLDNAKAEWASWELPGLGAYVDEPATVYIYATEFAPAKTIRLDTQDDAAQPIGATFKGPGDDAMFRKVFAFCGRPYAMPAPTPPAKAGN